MRGYFFIYKRTLQSGNKIYYYQAYKPDGTLTSGKSTGCKTKSAAIHYCQTLLMQGRIWTGSNILFTTYAEHFFDYDSIWVQNKMASGTPEHPALSNLYLKKLQSTVRLHLLPYFGNKKFSMIKPTDVKELRLFLLREKKLSFKSVNDVISVFKIIVDVALADDVLTMSPLRGIRPLMNNYGPRDAFTIKEAKTIFQADWKNNETARMFNFVAACTGMRLSEINAIRKENLKPTYIDLRDQLLRGKLSPLKTKEARRIPICRELYEVLNARIDNNYAFVIGQNIGSKCLAKVLDRIMPQEKKEHGYSFHSWRHFFNTYYNKP